MIREWIGEYSPKTKGEAEAALREIMQEVALAGLQRAGFFEKAAFYGGTALRILHGLNRYSEDLDFSLLHSDPDFVLDPYFESIYNEFNAVGMKVSIREKKKSASSSIESAFLKPETVWRELILEGTVPQSGYQASPGIKIKLEVDREPPAGFETEEKLLLRPFSFYVKCFILPDLFAGKMHALLFRKWGQRVKGRDWYDFEWYIKKGVPLHLHHFLLRAKDSNDWKEDAISPDQFLQLLHKKIEEVSFESILLDITKFIPDDSVFTIWRPPYFKELAQQLKFQ